MRTDEVQVYETTDGWRWRYVNGDNGLTLADGSQGYTDVRDAVSGARRVCGLRGLPGVTGPIRLVGVTFRRRRGHTVRLVIL